MPEGKSPSSATPGSTPMPEAGKSQLPMSSSTNLASSSSSPRNPLRFRPIHLVDRDRLLAQAEAAKKEDIRLFSEIWAAEQGYIVIDMSSEKPLP